jgi:hypothetical protein
MRRDERQHRPHYDSLNDVGDDSPP